MKEHSIRSIDCQNESDPISRKMCRTMCALLNDDYYRDWYYSLFDKTKLFWLFSSEQREPFNEFDVLLLLGPQVNRTEFWEICIPLSSFFSVRIKSVTSLKRSTVANKAHFKRLLIEVSQHSKGEPFQSPCKIHAKNKCEKVISMGKPWKEIIRIENAATTNPAETDDRSNNAKRSFSCVLDAMRCEKFPTPIMSSSSEAKWKIWAKCGHGDEWNVYAVK